MQNNKRQKCLTKNISQNGRIKLPIMLLLTILGLIIIITGTVITAFASACVGNTHVQWYPIASVRCSNCGQNLDLEECACGQSRRLVDSTGEEHICSGIGTGHVCKPWKYVMSNDKFHAVYCNCGKCIDTVAHKIQYKKIVASDGKEDDRNHSRICSDNCGYSVVQKHQFDETKGTYINDAVHSVKCTMCGYLIDKPHNINGKAVQCEKDGCTGIAYRYCTICNKPIPVSHICSDATICSHVDKDYVSVSSEKHKLICANKACKKELGQELHTWKNSKEGLFIKKECIYCKLVIYIPVEEVPPTEDCKHYNVIRGQVIQDNDPNTCREVKCLDCSKVLESIGHEKGMRYCSKCGENYVDNVCAYCDAGGVHENCKAAQKGTGKPAKPAGSDPNGINNDNMVGATQGTNGGIGSLNTGAGEQTKTYVEYKGHILEMVKCEYCGKEYPYPICVQCGQLVDIDMHVCLDANGRAVAHQCIPGKNYESDMEGHTEICAVEGCGKVLSEYEKHIDKNPKDTICDVCGWVIGMPGYCVNGEHKFQQTLCAHCKSAVVSMKCKVCGYEVEMEGHICNQHTCIEEDKYSKDTNYHWKQCAVVGCEKLVKDKELHIDKDNNKICDICDMELPNCDHTTKHVENCVETCTICGIIVGVNHTGLQVTYDDKKHVEKCTACGYVGVEEKHKDEDKDRKCDVCDYLYNDEFDIGEEYTINNEVSELEVNLRSYPTIEKGNKNIFLLDEVLKYKVDYINASEDITDKVEIKLKLPLTCEVLNSMGGQVNNNTITWTYNNGLEKGVGGTKEILVKYTALSSSSKQYNIVEPIVTIYQKGKEKASSGITNLIAKDASTVITTKHEPYMKGDAGLNTFRPNDTVTRAEAAIIFSRIFGKANEKPKQDTKFVDLDGLYEEAINAIKLMEKYKYVQGYGNGEYRPNEPISRAEFMTILARKIEDDHNDNPAFVIKSNENSILRYSMYGEHWAINEMTLMLRLNMVNIDNDIDLRPYTAITRAEVTQLLNLYQFRAPAAMLYVDEINFVDLSRSHYLFPDILEATRSAHTYKFSITGIER